MTIFGLIATALCCGTVVFAIVWLSKKPIQVTHKYIHMHESKPVQETKPQDAPELEQKQETKNMDAVILAANALMGIQEDDGGSI
jgi:hypothetical protein